MEEDDEGFLFPVIDKRKCIDCGRCDAVCPCLNECEPIIPVNCYAYRSRDIETVKRSSSGGFFTLAATKVLESGGVVFGAIIDENYKVRHIGIESLDQLDRLRRSKYVQSCTDNTFNECRDFLDKGRTVLFCGSPCQIKALNLFIGHKYERLTTIDFVCHGVPSPGVFRKYLEEILHDSGAKEVKNINFRAKDLSGSAYAFSCDIGSQHILEPSSKSKYLNGFLKDVYLRRSCHNCCARNHVSNADYTMGDFWTIAKVVPSFPKYKLPGVSLVLIANDKLGLFPCDDADVARVVLKDRANLPCWLYESAPKNLRRDEFFRSMKAGGRFDVTVERLTKVGILQKIIDKTAFKWHKIVKKINK